MYVYKWIVARLRGYNHLLKKKKKKKKKKTGYNHRTENLHIR